MHLQKKVNPQKTLKRSIREGEEMAVCREKQRIPMVSEGRCGFLWKITHPLLILDSSRPLEGREQHKRTPTLTHTHNTQPNTCNLEVVAENAILVLTSSVLEASATKK